MVKNLYYTMSIKTMKRALSLRHDKGITSKYIAYFPVDRPRCCFEKYRYIEYILLRNTDLNSIIIMNHNRTSLQQIDQFSFWSRYKVVQAIK